MMKTVWNIAGASRWSSAAFLSIFLHVSAICLIIAWNSFERDAVAVIEGHPVVLNVSLSGMSPAGLTSSPGSDSGKADAIEENAVMHENLVAQPVQEASVQEVSVQEVSVQEPPVNAEDFSTDETPIRRLGLEIEAGIEGIDADASPSPGIALGEVDELWDQYRLQLMLEIDRNKIYPTMAKRFGQEARVLVRFTLAPDGSLMNEPVLARASQFSSLNEAALTAVHNAAPFPALPADLRVGAAGSQQYQIEIIFELN